MNLCRLLAVFFLSAGCFFSQAKEKNSYLVELTVLSEKGYKINDAYLINQNNSKLIGISFQGKLTFKAQLPLSISISHISYENQI